MLVRDRGDNAAWGQGVCQPARRVGQLARVMAWGAAKVMNLSHDSPDSRECPKGTATPSRIRPGSVGAFVIKQCFRTYDFPRRYTRLVGQKIETYPAATERRSDHSQC